MKILKLFLLLFLCNFYSLFSFDFFKIFKKMSEHETVNSLSANWKEELSQSFYKDLNFIESIVQDGSMLEADRDDFLKFFKDQQNWFDSVISSTQELSDPRYKEIEEKKLFVATVANSQRRADNLIKSSTRKSKQGIFDKKKIRLNVLVDINNYVVNEFKNENKSFRSKLIADKYIRDIVKNNINNNKNKQNKDISKLITKNDYRDFAYSLNNNINNSIKNVFAKLENKIEAVDSKHGKKARKKYEKLLNSLDMKLTTTHARLQAYIDQKMQEFSSKIEELTNSQAKKENVIDLDLLENKFKNYLDNRLQSLEAKFDAAKAQESKAAKAQESKDKSKKDNMVLNISKRKIDEKIYEEVGRQLSALKEQRIRKFEKLSKRKKQNERKKLLRKLLDAELDNNFS